MGYWMIGFKFEAPTDFEYQRIKNCMREHIQVSEKDANSCWRGWEEVSFSDKERTITGSSECRLPGDIIEMACTVSDELTGGLHDDSPGKNDTAYIRYTITGWREYSAGGGYSNFIIEQDEEKLTLRETDWYNEYSGECDSLKYLLESIIEEFDLSNDYCDELWEFDDISELRDYCETSGMLKDVDVDLDKLFTEGCAIYFTDGKQIYIDEDPEYGEKRNIDRQFEWN